MRYLVCLICLLVITGGARGAADPGALVTQLGSEWEASAEAAERELVALGPAAMPVLEELFADRKASAGTLERAVRVLGEIKDDRSTALLIQAMQRRIDPWRAADALATRGEEGFAALVAGLRDPAEEVGLAAASALGETDNPRAVKPLAEALRSGRLAMTAAQALVRLGPAGRTELMALLRSDDAGLVALAARMLGRPKDEAAARALAGLLGHRDPAVRGAVVTAVGEQGYAPAAPALARLLQDSDRRVRGAAAAALVMLRELGPVEKTLHSADPADRLNAVGALSGLYRKDVHVLLVGCLRDADQGVRRAAAQALRDRAEPEVISGMQPYLMDPDETIREAAASVFGKAPKAELRALLPRFAADDRQLGYLARMVGYGNDGRDFAARMLRQLRGTPAVERLTAMAGKGDSEQRQQAIDGLVATGDARVPPVLIRLLGDADTQVVERAATALTLDMPDPRAVEPLRAYVKRAADPMARGWGVSALARSGGMEVIDDLVAAMADQAAEVREDAVRELGNLEGVEAQGGRLIGPLVAALADPADEVRGTAGWVVSKLGAAAEPAVRAALPRAFSGGARQTIARTLATVATSDSVPVLWDLRGDPDEQVRQSALAGLAKARDPRAYDLLFPLLSSTDPVAQVRAMAGLAMLGDRRAAPTLVPLLRNSELLVRQSAAEALGELGYREAMPALTELADTMLSAAAGGPSREMMIDMHDADLGDGIAAMRALAKLGDPGATPVLLKLLSGGYVHCGGSIGEVAARELAAFDQPEVRDALLAALAESKPPDPFRQGAAAASLGKLHEMRAVPRLIELLGHQEYTVRFYATQALSQLGDRRAVPGLIELLDDEKQLEEMAAEALKAITGQAFGSDQARWRQWWGKQ